MPGEWMNILQHRKLPQTGINFLLCKAVGKVVSKEFTNCGKGRWKGPLNVHSSDCLLCAGYLTAAYLDVNHSVECGYDPLLFDRIGPRL